MSDSGRVSGDAFGDFTQLFVDFDVRKAVLSRFAHWNGTDTNKAVIAAIRAEGLRPSYVRALFTGDVEQSVFNSIATRLDARIDQPVDVLLATHHGSAHGSIDRLEATGASIWCTDTNGTITAGSSVAGKLTWSAEGPVRSRGGRPERGVRMMLMRPAAGCA